MSRQPPDKFYTPGEFRTRPRLTERGKAAALAQVRAHGIHLPSMAAAAGVALNAMRKAYAEDLEFRDQCERAHAVPIQRALKAMEERGIEGYKGPNGETKYSDRCLLALAQALDPERFGPRMKVEQQTRVTVDLPDTRKWPREAKIKMLEALALAKAAGGPPGLLAPTEPVDAEFEEHDSGDPDTGSAEIEGEADDGDLPEE